MSDTLPDLHVVPTLGALFVGINFSAVFYGVTCLQTFLYFTSFRSKQDGLQLRLFVVVLCVFDTVNQILNTVGVYKYVVSDFANPAAILSTGVSGSIRPPDAGFFLIINVIPFIITRTIVQLFYATRVWAVSFELRKSLKISLVVMITTLTIAQIGTTLTIMISSFTDSFFTQNNIKAGLRPIAYYIDTAIGVSCDILITCAMSVLLWRARSPVNYTGMNAVLNALILFTISTGLVTTLLIIIYLILYIFLPNTLIGPAVAFVLAKSFPNSALALLNSRSFLREKAAGSVSLPFIGQEPLHSSKPDVIDFLRPFNPSPSPSREPIQLDPLTV